MPSRCGNYNSAKAKRARTFNSYMPDLNEEWASRVLNIPRNPNRQNGPDLIDDKKAVEIKFKLLTETYSHKSWKVLQNQLRYNQKREAFWGLGFYTLSLDIENIDPKNLTKLESLVQNRELYLVNWDWMNQFPAYRQTGNTYDNTIIFPKFLKTPPIVKTVKVNKGLIYFTKGVDIDKFDINTSRK